MCAHFSIGIGGDECDFGGGAYAARYLFRHLLRQNNLPRLHALQAAADMQDFVQFGGAAVADVGACHDQLCLAQAAQQLVVLKKMPTRRFQKFQIAGVVHMAVAVQMIIEDADGKIGCRLLLHQQ